MRAALAGIMSSESVAIKVGGDSFELETSQDCVVEKKVKLPLRWLKGFVELQAYQCALQPRMELPAVELAKVIRTLPQQNILQAGSVTYMVPSGKSMRLSQRETPGAVGVGAISRLKALETILRYAKTVRIYSSNSNVTAFELICRGASLFVVLTPNAARGFSGEGQALFALAAAMPQEALATVRSALAWQPNLDARQLGEKLNLDTALVLSALQVLGTRGLVGYDLSVGAFFHRQLPFDLNLVEDVHPRMKKARQLFEEKCVRLAGQIDGEHYEAYVKGTKGEHFVSVTADGSRCTCDWYAKNQGARGPCSHMLAAELAAQEEGFGND
jgi:hypothetical protein